MSDLNREYGPVFGLQRFMWYLFAVAYGIATILYVAKASLAETFMVGTTLVLLVLTGAKLILIGNFFYRREMKRELVLTVLLLLVLASIALMEIF